MTFLDIRTESYYPDLLVARNVGAVFMEHSYHTKELMQTFDKDYITWNNCRKHEERCTYVTMNT